MEHELVFKLSSIEKAEEEYRVVSLSPEQKERLDAFVKIIAQYIPIPERALRGFMWRILREEQLEHHVDLAEEARIADKMKIDMEDRILRVEGILLKLKKNLTRILVQKEQESLLDKAIEKVLNFYKEQLEKM